MMKPLEISDASVEKATGLIEQLMGDNAKLLKALGEKRRRPPTGRCCMSRAVPRG